MADPDKMRKANFFLLMLDNFGLTIGPRRKAIAQAHRMTTTVRIAVARWMELLQSQSWLKLALRLQR